MFSTVDMVGKVSTEMKRDKASPPPTALLALQQIAQVKHIAP